MNSNPVKKIPKNKGMHSYHKTILNIVSTAKLSFNSRRRQTTLIFLYALHTDMKIMKLVSKPSKKVNGIDRHFI